MSKEILTQNKFDLMDDDRPKDVKEYEDNYTELLPFLRMNSRKLEDLHRAQFTKMNCLNQTFREDCEFLVFYEDDPLDPQYINGLKMGAFIMERFSSKNGCEYITDIFLNPNITISNQEVYIFVYNGKTKEWLS